MMRYALLSFFTFLAVLTATACGSDATDVEREPTADNGHDVVDQSDEPAPCPGAEELASELLVAPYLQAATPTGLWVMWETDSGTESRVEWGPTESLGRRQCGTVVTGQLSWPTTLHEARLKGLDPGTRYYYQVHTGTVTSEIHSFVTPPAPDSEAAFRFVAMSDMQRDDSRPTQFGTVVEHGIIPFVSDEYAVDPASGLGFAAVAGDLVVNGWRPADWVDDFFGQGASLFSQVPLYPALGNHEANTPLFARYFRFPDNGTPDFEEHWYYTDYSNVRLIALDSNEGYRSQTQLDWLDAVLSDACEVDTIDFVFAQLHHPHLSELWITGEIDFTGDVIGRLEAFSADCGKPSAHLFGHTHGYARGQSRDHAHLWVNVATAGGAIDRWGFHEQTDYDELTVSQDEYGFVIFEIEAGDAPELRLTRVSLGDAEELLENVVRDEVTIRRFNTAPTTPIPVGPSAVTVPCEQPITLQAGSFEDEDDDTHYAAHWQVSADCESFSALVVDRWRQAENWYADEDTRAGDDLTDEQLEQYPAPGAYCWRVRYRDDGLAWSDWSTAQPFTVPTCE